MTKKKQASIQEEAKPEIPILPNVSNKENSEKIRKDHKKSRIKVTEQKLVELEEV